MMCNWVGCVAVRMCRVASRGRFACLLCERGAKVPDTAGDHSPSDRVVHVTGGGLALQIVHHDVACEKEGPQRGVAVQSMVVGIVE